MLLHAKWLNLVGALHMSN